MLHMRVSMNYCCIVALTHEGDEDRTQITISENQTQYSNPTEENKYPNGID